MSNNIEVATKAFWSAAISHFPELMSINRDLDDADCNALAAWENNSELKTFNIVESINTIPCWISKNRVTDALEDGLMAAGTVLFPGRIFPVIHGSVLGQLEGCICHLIRQNLN